MRLLDQFAWRHVQLLDDETRKPGHIRQLIPGDRVKADQRVGRMFREPRRLCIGHGDHLRRLREEGQEDITLIGNVQADPAILAILQPRSFGEEFARGIAPDDHCAILSRNPKQLAKDGILARGTPLPHGI